MPALIKDVAAHLSANVDIDPATGCWLWRLSRKNGYGRFRNELAHRVSYETFVGPIPDGLQIDHVRARGCAYRHCINPSHLEPVSQPENIRRSDAPTIVNWRTNVCSHGHSMADAYPSRRNGKVVGRTCRTCTREKNAARYQTRRRYLDEATR